METVGIIMAAYNGEKYIGEQMESVLNNSYQNIKVWVWDDGSTDNTISIIEGYVEAYPDKVFLCKNSKNVGVVLNFLQALKKSDTQYTMFCDQDDVWKKDKIKHTIDEMHRLEKKYPSKVPLCVFTDAVVTDASLKTVFPSFYKAAGLNTDHLALHSILMENKVQGCTAMVNEAAKLKLYRLPENARMHDWWMALICAAFGKISFLEEQTLLYRQHEKNVIGNQRFTAYVKNRISSLKEQKRVLLKTQKQAGEFYNLYKMELPEKMLELVLEFSKLQKKSWLEKRYKIIKYRFFKTGIIRNIGVMLIL